MTEHDIWYLYLFVIGGKAKGEQAYSTFVYFITKPESSTCWILVWSLIYVTNI